MKSTSGPPRLSNRVSASPSRLTQAQNRRDRPCSVLVPVFRHPRAAAGSMQPTAHADVRGRRSPDAGVLNRRVRFASTTTRVQRTSKRSRPGSRLPRHGGCFTSGWYRSASITAPVPQCRCIALDNCCPIEELGHASLETTSVYAHARPTDDCDPLRIEADPAEQGVLSRIRELKAAGYTNRFAP